MSVQRAQISNQTKTWDELFAAYAEVKKNWVLSVEKFPGWQSNIPWLCEKYWIVNDAWI